MLLKASTVKCLLRVKLLLLLWLLQALCVLLLLGLRIGELLLSPQNVAVSHEAVDVIIIVVVVVMLVLR